MNTIFHDGEIWDQFEDPMQARQNKEPIPLYAWCYNHLNKTWWIWYHSWNPTTEALQHGARELPPVCRAFLLVLGEPAP